MTAFLGTYPADYTPDPVHVQAIWDNIKGRASPCKTYITSNWTGEDADMVNAYPELIGFTFSRVTHPDHTVHVQAEHMGIVVDYDVRFQL